MYESVKELLAEIQANMNIIKNAWIAIELAVRNLREITDEE